MKHLLLVGSWQGSPPAAVAEEFPGIEFRTANAPHGAPKEMSTSAFDCLRELSEDRAVVTFARVLDHKGEWMEGLGNPWWISLAFSLSVDGVVLEKKPSALVLDVLRDTGVEIVVEGSPDVPESSK